jgi:hypothetical protein
MVKRTLPPQARKACFQFDNLVLSTVKGPDRDVPELTGEFRETTSTGDVDVRFSRMPCLNSSIAHLKLDFAAD